MKIGVVFPQTEIGQDPAVIRDYAQAVESMGYTHTHPRKRARVSFKAEDDPASAGEFRDSLAAPAVPPGMLSA